MKKFISLILTLCILGSMIGGLSVSAEENWTDGFKVTSGKGATITSDKIVLDAASGDTTSLVVGKDIPISSSGYDVEFTMAMEVWGRSQNICIGMGSLRWYFDIYKNKINYMPESWATAPNEWQGFDYPLGTEKHTYRIIGSGNVGELYIDGYYIGTAKVHKTNEPQSVVFNVNGRSGRNKMVLYDFHLNKYVAKTQETQKEATPVENVYYDFNDKSQMSDWVNETEPDIWKVENGALKSNCTTDAYTKTSWRVSKEVGYADDFDFHARMRYTSEEYYITFAFKLPNKWLSFYKLETVWYYDTLTSGSVPYQGNLAPKSGEWFDVDIKTYNSCEGAKIYVNGNLALDIPFDNKTRLTGMPRIIIMNAASGNLCKYSNVEIDSLSFEPRYNNIKIDSILEGDEFLEGDDIEISSKFAGNTAPEEITYYLNGVEYTTASAPDYKATLSGLPAGKYKINAVGGKETSITKNISVLQAVEGKINAAKTGKGYTLTTVLNDELNQVSEVEYLLDGVPVGSSKTAPYKVDISEVSNANHTVGAICKSAGGLTLAEYTYILKADLSGNNVSENFSNEISYTVSENAEYDFANGLHRLYLKHTDNGVAYLTDSGEKTYKNGTGNFRIITNHEFADVYRNGQLAFSYIMPTTEDVYKKTSSIKNESVKIPEGKATHFRQNDIKKGAYTYNFPGIPYIYQLEFVAKKTDDFRFVINDGYYRTDIALKDGKFIVWDGGVTGEVKAPVERVLCDAVESNENVYYRLETSLGMSMLYANGKWLATFRSSRSVGGQYMGITTESGIKYAAINSGTDVFTYIDNFDGAGEFESSEYWYKGYDLSIDKNGIALKAKSGEEAYAEINAYAGNLEFSADVTVDELNGGFWITMDRAIDDTYSRIGYNAETKNFEAIDCYDKAKTTVASQAGTLPYGKKINVKVKAVQHEKIKDVALYIDGTPVLTYQKKILQRGRFGFVIDGGSATIHNASYCGDTRVVRGAQKHFLIGMVDPTVEAFDRNGEIVLTSTGSGRAVSSDGGRTFVREPSVTGDGFNVYQFVDENGEPTGELLDLVFYKTGNTESGASIRNARIYRSLDYGATWTEEGLLYPEPEPLLNYRYCGITRGPSGRMYYCVQYLHNEMEGSCLALYSDDKGKTWTKSETYIDFNEVGVRNQETMIAELSDGRVRIYSRNDLGYIHYYESYDGGKTFDKTVHDTPFLSALNCFQIEYDPYDPGTLYACWSMDNVNASKTEQMPRSRWALARSLDDGETWEYLGTYYEFLPQGDGHNSSNLCMAITKDKLIMNCWSRISYKPNGNAAFDSGALVIDKDKLQPTAAFEQVHMIETDSATTSMKVDPTDMIVINPENGYVFKGGEVYFGGADGRFVSAEIIASYTSTILEYKNDGSVSYKIGKSETVFGPEYVKECEGKKFVSIDAFAEKFGLSLVEADNAIIIDSNSDNVDLKKMAAQHTIDVFKDISKTAEDK